MAQVSIIKERLEAYLKARFPQGRDLPVETMSSLRQQIRSVLRQQLDHGVARVASMMPPALNPATQDVQLKGTEC